MPPCFTPRSSYRLSLMRGMRADTAPSTTHAVTVAAQVRQSASTNRVRASTAAKNGAAKNRPDMKSPPIETM